MREDDLPFTPPGKRQQKTMERYIYIYIYHHFLAGKIHYFDWVIFNSFNCKRLPEGSADGVEFDGIRMLWSAEDVEQDAPESPKRRQKRRGRAKTYKAKSPRNPYW